MRSAFERTNNTPMGGVTVRRNTRRTLRASVDANKKPRRVVPAGAETLAKDGFRLKGDAHAHLNDPRATCLAENSAKARRVIRVQFGVS